MRNTFVATAVPICEVRAMRETLFRGKRCDNGKWVQGFYVRADHHWHKNGIHKDWIALGASANGGWFALHNKYAVKTETVGQYTGLTDKNGKKVFEGDIVRNGDYTMIVVWYDFHAAFMLAFRVDGDYFEAISNSHIYLEVIGNIHDNPELLGGGDDGT